MAPKIACTCHYHTVSAQFVQVSLIDFRYVSNAQRLPFPVTAFDIYAFFAAAYYHQTDIKQAAQGVLNDRITLSLYHF